MGFLKYNGVGIRGIAAAVPGNVIDNYTYSDRWPQEDINEIIGKIGVKERRFAEAGVCASDLCYAAAEKLLNDLSVDRNEIGLVVFVSQTPDYKMPSTSIILQHRLELLKSTIAFDLNIGCSGYLYGLSVIYSFMQSNNIPKALLLDGEVRSRVYSAKDRTTAFLFGDAGTATLIEKDSTFGESIFSLNSDGERSDFIKIDAGGSRLPSSEETLKERIIDEYGNIRSQEHGYMQGADVFNFLIREVPKDIKNTLKYAAKTNDDFDYFVFHQANKFINGYLAKKMKIDRDKIPMSIEKYGNTSSVSIPLTIVSELQHKTEGNRSIFLAGFGVGLSWGCAVINTNNLHISDIVEI